VYTFTTADAASSAACGLVHKRSFDAAADAPLFVLIHGRAGNHDVMSAFKGCIPPGCNVLLPQAHKPDAQGGFSWWTVDEDIYFRERAASAAEQMRAFIEGVTAHYRLAPRRTVAFGFSQGAALLSVLIQRSSGMLQGAALLAGFVIEEAGTPAPPLPEILIAHGLNDEVVAVPRARKGADFLRGRGYAVEYHEDPVGHKIGSQGMRALRAFAARASGIEQHG
jgi:predicted esterase